MSKTKNTKIAGDSYLTAGQQFVIKTQKRQKKLFINSPIIKSVLIISLPSMVIALMTSLYIFSDQIIMANLIPNFKPFENLVGPDYQKFLEYVKIAYVNSLLQAINKLHDKILIKKYKSIYNNKYMSLDEINKIEVLSLKMINYNIINDSISLINKILEINRQ